MEIVELEKYLDGALLSRNKAQVFAMSAVYDALTYISMGQPIDVEGIVSGLTGVSYEESDYFIKKTLIEAIKHHDEAIAEFNAHMNKWKFDRLNRVEQAILLLSYAHYKFVEEDVDKGVVINIAIRLAKTFLEDNDYKFVNAILDKVLVR